MSVTSVDVQKIEDLVSPLVGQSSWEVMIGRDNTLIFNFGGKRRLGEDKVGEEVGEWQLLIHSYWRLETKLHVITGSGDERDKVLPKIKQLENLSVHSIKVTPPSLYTTN